MWRSRCIGIVLLILAAGCWEARPRPSPVEVEGNAGLSVTVLRPLSNAVVLAGRPLEIEVEARDEASQAVSGIGYVTRQVQGGQTIDSVTVSFAPRAAARDTFEMLVPAQLVTNTHLSITALAFRANGATRGSVAKQVVVAQCS